MDAVNQLDLNHHYGEIEPTNTMMSLVLSSNFICANSNGFRDHLSVLLTCKAWNSMLSSASYKRMQIDFGNVEKLIVERFPFSRIAIKDLTSVDGCSTFRQLSITCLQRLREIQELIHDLKCSSDESNELFFELLTNVKLVANEFFWRIDKNPYNINLFSSGRAVFKKNDLLFSNPRFGMINSDFCNKAEKALILATLPDEYIMSKFNVLFTDWKRNRLSLKSIWMNVCVGNSAKSVVKEYFLRQALAQSHVFALAGSRESLYGMNIYFENNPLIEEYKSLYFDVKLHYAELNYNINRDVGSLCSMRVKVARSSGNSPLRHRQLRVEKLLKIANVLTHMGLDEEAENTLKLVPIAHSLITSSE